MQKQPRMIILHSFIAVLLLVACAGATFPAVLLRLASMRTFSLVPVYVEPGLGAQTDGLLPLVVSGRTTTQAAAAVVALGGTVSSELWLIDAVAAKLPTAELMQLARTDGIRAIVRDSAVASSALLMTPQDDERALAEYLASLQAASPLLSEGEGAETPYLITRDMGVDQVHDRGITGYGVTVAVVDSGVYFDAATRSLLDQAPERFVGQADFVGETANCQESNATFCLVDHHASQDGFGHGSYVAGILWSSAQEHSTGTALGVAPGARLLSVRVLNDEGIGTYADVIEGIQYVVANQAHLGVRVMNLSISAQAVTPYHADPLNQAVMAAWSAGVVVVTAAGNQGPAAQTISTPGNTPDVITVGAVDGNGTAGDWSDDRMPSFSSAGPTLDGYAKPDLVAPGVNIGSALASSSAAVPQLTRTYPGYDVAASQFRLHGASLATAAVSGVVALMLEANPALTPDEVKSRLMGAAAPINAESGEPCYGRTRQGAGRVWAPEAIWGELDPRERAGWRGWESRSVLDEPGSSEEFSTSGWAWAGGVLSTGNGATPERQSGFVYALDWVDSIDVVPCETD